MAQLKLLQGYEGDLKTPSNPINEQEEINPAFSEGQLLFTIQDARLNNEISGINEQYGGYIYLDYLYDTKKYRLPMIAPYSDKASYEFTTGTALSVSVPADSFSMDLINQTTLQWTNLKGDKYAVACNYYPTNFTWNANTGAVNLSYYLQKGASNDTVIYDSITLDSIPIATETTAGILTGEVAADEQRSNIQSIGGIKKFTNLVQITQGDAASATANTGALQVTGGVRATAGSYFASTVGIDGALNVNNTGTFSGNVFVGTESAANPYYKLTDSNKNTWYFQALDNKCYIGPTSEKALNIDTSGNISAVGSISIGRKADTTMGDISVAIGYDVIASGKYSHAEGRSTKASGSYSHAAGYNTTASGSYSHTEGRSTKASGSYSHAEGDYTTASGDYSHAEGDYTTASGDYSHAEGDYTTASGDYSHAEGRSTKASGDYSHAEGYYTVAPQAYMNVIGANNLYTANKIYIKTTTGYSRAYNISQRVYVYDNYYLNGDTLGYDGVPVYTYVDNLSVGDLFYNSSTLSSTIYECTKKSYYTDENSNVEYVRITYSNHSVVNPATEKGDYVHIVGNGASSSALSNAHTLDWSGNAWFAGDVYVGSTSGTNKDDGSVALMKSVHPTGTGSFRLNKCPDTITLESGEEYEVTIGEKSTALGDESIAEGYASHAEGFSWAGENAQIRPLIWLEGPDPGSYAHAEGLNTAASGTAAHAEGNSTIAYAPNSHAEGILTNASGAQAHVEGYQSQALADNSHAEGQDTVASGNNSHAQNLGTITNSAAQTAMGKYNIIDTTSALIIGNGTSKEVRSNAHTLDWDGNAWFAGDVYVGSTSGTNKDTGSKKLATESFVINNYLPLTGGTVTGVTKFSNSTDSTSTTTGAVQITGGLGVAKNIRGNKVYGAVWNDYAEYRQTHHKVRAGQCVYEKGDGSLAISYERMMPGANIVSDTFGFAIGETDDCKTPLAVSGRVLAYPYEPKETYNPGDAVCSGPNGTISKMTRAEIRDYPERIVGTVSEIPTYEVWGSGNIKVNGRIWIKVR